METVVVDGCSLDLPGVAAVASGGAVVHLDPRALSAVERARQLVQAIANDDAVTYGINTGFGSLATVRISSTQLRELQKNLLLSHAAGVGDPLPRPIVRAMMLLRLNSLLTGHSGPRASVLELIVDFLNRGITPVVPEKGSLGASGDLAPLAHTFLPLIGLGEVWLGSERMTAREALAQAGLEPLALDAKEGLSLINGTQAMTALGCASLIEADAILRSADIAAALTLEGLHGIADAFDEQLLALRPQPGQQITGANIRALTDGSERVGSPVGRRVQDAYSLRCVPQIHGAVLDAIRHVASVVSNELNAATDNPLVFPETGRVLSGGNFHGECLALALDYLGIAVTEIASVSERRIERLLNPALSGLPAFLSPHPGLHSGLMIAQYTAAALVAESRVLASPASVDSIPVSAGQEDHVSMGHHAGRKSRTIVRNTACVVAIELLAAAQALDLGGTEVRLGTGTAAAHAAVRAMVPRLDRDRYLADDINRVADAVQSGEILALVEAALGVQVRGPLERELRPQVHTAAIPAAAASLAAV